MVSVRRQGRRGTIGYATVAAGVLTRESRRTSTRHVFRPICAGAVSRRCQCRPGQLELEERCWRWFRATV